MFPTFLSCIPAPGHPIPVVFVLSVIGPITGKLRSDHLSPTGIGV